MQEEKSGEKASEARDIKLYGQVPPIDKMDASLSTLTNCEWVLQHNRCFIYVETVFLYIGWLFFSSGSLSGLIICIVRIVLYLYAIP